MTNYSLELLDRANELNADNARNLSNLSIHGQQASIGNSNPAQNWQANMEQNMREFFCQQKSELMDEFEIRRKELDALNKRSAVTSASVTKPVYQTLDKFHSEDPFKKYTRDSRGVLVTAETRGENIPEIHTLGNPSAEHDLYRLMSRDHKRDRRICEVVRQIGKRRWDAQTKEHLCTHLCDFAIKAREHNLSELEILYKIDTVLPRAQYEETRTHIAKRAAPYIQEERELECKRSLSIKYSINPRIRKIKRRTHQVTFRP